MNERCSCDGNEEPLTEDDEVPILIWDLMLAMISFSQNANVFWTSSLSK
jgi:hypothetical protein